MCGNISHKRPETPRDLQVVCSMACVPLLHAAPYLPPSPVRRAHEEEQGADWSCRPLETVSLTTTESPACAWNVSSPIWLAEAEADLGPGTCNLLIEETYTEGSIKAMLTRSLLRKDELFPVTGGFLTSSKSFFVASIIAW